MGTHENLLLKHLTAPRKGNLQKTNSALNRGDSLGWRRTLYSWCHGSPQFAWKSPQKTWISPQQNHFQMSESHNSKLNFWVSRLQDLELGNERPRVSVWLGHERPRNVEKNMLKNTRWAPDPVISGVITSLSRVFTQVTQLFSAIYRGPHVTLLITGRQGPTLYTPEH